MKRKYKKYGFKETKFNESKIRRAYHLYLHQTPFDQILDVLVFFAISFTVIEIIGTFIFSFPSIITHTLHSFSVLVLMIFGLELMREYATSEQRREFFKKHWLDFVLVVFMSIYLFGAAYLGIAKIQKLAKVNNFVKETKHAKIALRAIGVIK